MEKVGGFWLAGTEKKPGEKLIHSFLANRTQSSYRVVGGKLFVTTTRCIFLPHLIDYLLGGKKSHINLSELESASIEPPDGKYFNGGLRKRLKLSHSQGDELFVVANPTDAVQKIGALLK